MADNQDQSGGRSSNAAIFDRVHRVENEISEVREMLAGLTVNVQGLTTSVSQLGQAMQARSGTDWKALAAWASVIVAFVGLGGTMVLSPVRQQLADNTQSVDRLNEGRILDARAALADARQQVINAEERGRYRQRVDYQTEELERLAAELEALRRLP